MSGQCACGATENLIRVTKERNPTLPRRAPPPTKTASQMFEGVSWQGLGEDICKLVFGVHVLDIDLTVHNVLSKVVQPNSQVLRTWSELRVICELERARVVFKDTA